MLCIIWLFSFTHFDRCDVTLEFWLALLWYPNKPYHFFIHLLSLYPISFVKRPFKSLPFFHWLVDLYVWLLSYWFVGVLYMFWIQVLFLNCVTHILSHSVSRLLYLDLTCSISSESVSLLFMRSVVNSAIIYWRLTNVSGVGERGKPTARGSSCPEVDKNPSSCDALW